MKGKHSSGKLLFTLVLCALVGLHGCAVDSGSEDEGPYPDFENPVSESSASTGTIGTVSSVDESFSRTIAFCATEEPSNDGLANLSMLFADFQAERSAARSAAVTLARTSATIPVYFHVISKGPTEEEGEVPDAPLIEQIEVLNSAYSGETGGVATPFRFTLAGINRVRNADWHVMSPGSETEMQAKQELKQGAADTLNVYLVDIQASGEVSGGRGTILGYTTLPVFYPLLAQYDGVVLHYKAIVGGPLAHYDTGHVLVHEVGHWLGLLHTFSGQCDGFFDDLISDTPREKTPESGNYCPVDRDSCPDLDGEDPVHNHMTYTADECRSEFTAGQVDFMVFNASIFRSMQLY